MPIASSQSWWMFLGCVSFTVISSGPPGAPVGLIAASSAQTGKLRLAGATSRWAVPRQELESPSSWALPESPLPSSHRVGLQPFHMALRAVSCPLGSFPSSPLHCASRSEPAGTRAARPGSCLSRGRWLLVSIPLLCFDKA